MEPEELANSLRTIEEQMAWQREQWARNRRLAIDPPFGRAARAWMDEVVRVTNIDGVWRQEREPMPPQEDEIVLLDEAPERAAPRAARLPTISIDLGISEISATQASTLTRKRGRKVVIKPEKEKPQAILYRGQQLYCAGKSLFLDSGGNANHIAYTQYCHVPRGEKRTPALAMMHGNTPVFFTSKEDMAAFKELLEKVDISVAEGKSLAFFTGTEYWCGEEHLLVIVSNGEIIRYGAVGNDERIMRLTDPIDQTPDQIFTAITSFTTKSVAGVSNLLEIEKKNLKLIEDRRSEDVFLYLSDMTPLAGREDVHQFALDRIQDAYNADLSQEAIIKNTIKGHADKINKAKSQLPSGRKGVPLRNSYLKSKVITDLLDFFKVIRGGPRLKVIFGFKKPLVVQNIQYGRPELTINMDCRDEMSRRGGTFILESQGVTARSADKNAFLHPHIEGNVRWCLGTYIVPVNNAIMGGNIPMAASLLWQYLSTYNPESPLIRIETCRDQMAMARPRDLIVRRK